MSLEVYCRGKVIGHADDITIGMGDDEIAAMVGARYIGVGGTPGRRGSVVTKAFEVERPEQASALPNFTAER